MARIGAYLVVAATAYASLSGACATAAEADARPQAEGQAVSLPAAQTAGGMALARAIASRRSRRSYSAERLELAELGQLLWAAQGITEPRRGLRTSPSAGATYPLELLACVGEGGVRGLAAGVYRYRPGEHALDRWAEGDLRAELSAAALGQGSVAQGAAVLVLAADVARTARRYGDRAERYVHMEAGHAAQNVYLQAEALDLGTVAVGAFSDEAVGRLLELPDGLSALYVMPVGRPR